MHGLELTSAAGKEIELALSGRTIHQRIHFACAKVVAQLCSKCGNCTAVRVHFRHGSASFCCIIQPSPSPQKESATNSRGNACIRVG